MSRRDIHNILMRRFTPPNGYALDSYYGTAYMKLKKNSKYQVKLLYDYSKHAQTSNAIYFDTFEMCIKALTILEEYAKNKKEKSIDDELLDMLKTVD